MRGLLHIKCSGEIDSLNNKLLSLEEAQELVATGTENSLIELVYITNELALVIHEEGLVRDLPDNERAMSMVDWKSNMPLVGDAILVHLPEEKEL